MGKEYEVTIDREANPTGQQTSEKMFKFTCWKDEMWIIGKKWDITVKLSQYLKLKMYVHPTKKWGIAVFLESKWALSSKINTHTCTHTRIYTHTRTDKECLLLSKNVCFLLLLGMWLDCNFWSHFTDTSNDCEQDCCGRIGVCFFQAQPI